MARLEGSVTSPTQLLGHLVLSIRHQAVVSAQWAVAVGPTHQHHGAGDVEHVQQVDVVLTVR